LDSISEYVLFAGGGGGGAGGEGGGGLAEVERQSVKRALGVPIDPSHSSLT